jgi:diaminohydroxyphosphoribosylaminopyrimidine deaminase/5-amino-6-(5-phosphoribosylamino)uracil reductase
MVGALVFRDGTVVAEGYHRAYGDLHAEAAALDAAGDAAKNSTLYCNLEPCSYESPEKHQPPCTRRIIASGVRRVVIGQLDPNPNIRGRGVRILREAGIDVVTAAQPREFWRFNDAFNTYMALGRPFVHLKLAMSLDGRLATASGDSKWISNESARGEVHAFRAEREAVAVGVGTLLADDPSLTVRLSEGSNPLPVVFDSTLRTPIEASLVRERGEELILLAARPPAEDPGFNMRKSRLEAMGARILTVASRNGRVDLHGALEALTAAGIRSLLLEGGATLATAFLREGLFDRLTAYVAPIILGSGIDAVGPLGINVVPEALSFEGVSWRQLGDQQVFDAYREGWFEGVRASVKEESDVYRTC